MSRSHEKFPRPLLAVMALFAVLVLALPLLFWFRLEYYEVCPQCARQRDVQRWLIPFTGTSYYDFHVIEDSPLTVRLEEFAYVDEHEHAWLIVRGNGPGTTDILGEGLRVAPGLVSPSIASFVDLLQRHTDPETVAYWFARMTHPQQSDFVRNVADKCARESFADAEAFRGRLKEIAAFERRLLIERLGRVDEPEARTPPRLLYQRPPR
jgi:hypothetical protein